MTGSGTKLPLLEEDHLCKRAAAKKNEHVLGIHRERLRACTRKTGEHVNFLEDTDLLMEFFWNKNVFIEHGTPWKFLALSKGIPSVRHCERGQKPTLISKLFRSPRLRERRF